MKRQIKQSGSKQSPLSPLFKLAKVEPDPAFKELLEEARQEPIFKAPASFRQMLLNLQPINWGFSCGYSYKNGKHVLTWFLSEFGAKGSPEDVVSRISEPLLSDGFQMTKEPDYTNAFEMIKDSGSIQQKCTIQRIARFVGSREPRAGGYLLFEVELEEPGDMMTVAQLLDVYPELRCPDVPVVYMEYLNSCNATSVDYGGSYIVYYDWSTTIACEGNDAAANLLEEMKALVIDNGGVLDDREVDRGVYTYFQPEMHPPVVYLSNVDGTGVNFRLQPRM